MSFTPQKPRGRVVTASEVIEMETVDNPEPDAPRIHRPIDEVSRIQRLIHVSDMAITPYEKKLARGLILSVEEERMMNTHINTLMKLEMNKAVLEARSQLQKKSNAELAQYMYERGMTKEQISTFFGSSREVDAALEELG